MAYSLLSTPSMAWRRLPAIFRRSGTSFRWFSSKDEKSKEKKSDPRTLHGYEKTYHEYLNVVRPYRQRTSSSSDPSDPRNTENASYVEPAYTFSNSNSPTTESNQPHYPETIKFSQEQLPINSDWTGKYMKPGSIYQVHELGDESKYQNIDTTRKIDVFDAMGTDPIKMYKNVAMLSQFVSETGMILGRKSTNLSIKNQRKLSKVIKRARAIGLLPYTSRLPLQPHLLPIDIFRYP